MLGLGPYSHKRTGKGRSVSYKDTFEKALLKSEQLISTETRAPQDAECAFDNDLRLVFISKLAKALDRLQHMPEISGGKSYTASSIRNFLGNVVSIRHTDDPSNNHSEIQFACPNGDKNRLFVSVYWAYSSRTQPAHRTDTYEYNIASSHKHMGAAHARLVTWLGQTIGPDIEIQKRVTKILENLEPVALSVERDVPQATTGAHIQAGPARDPV